MPAPEFLSPDQKSNVYDADCRVAAASFKNNIGALAHQKENNIDYKIKPVLNLPNKEEKSTVLNPRLRAKLCSKKSLTTCFFDATEIYMDCDGDGQISVT